MLQKWVEDTSQFNKDLIKNYNEESDKRCLLEVDVQYLKKFHELHDDLPFLPEQIKIEKVEKLIADLHVIPTRNLKHALNHGLILKEVHRVIKFNPNAWIKPYNDMNSDQRKKRKFFKVDK